MKSNEISAQQEATLETLKVGILEAVDLQNKQKAAAAAAGAIQSFDRKHWIK